MSEKKPVCAMLMRVGPVFPGLLDDGEGDERVLTAQYTCSKTATAVGPDSLPAEPETCNQARQCFLAEQ